MRILGIDPGLRLAGYGCVDVDPGKIHPTLVEAGVIRLDARTSVAERLKHLFDDLEEIIGDLKPTRLAVEEVFSHAKHVRTSILMGHARGVVLLCAQRHDLALTELAPTEIKKSMTGNGHATKAQMQQAVMNTFGLSAPPEPPDVADAIAIATCDARRSGLTARR